MTRNVFITRRIPEIAEQMLKEKGYDAFVRENDAPPSQEELNAALKEREYDAVITLLTDKIDDAIFNENPHIKLYANYAIGYDNIDIAAAKEKNILITNTPGDYANAVAEHTIALMLALTTKLVEADEFMRAGKYKYWSPSIFLGTDLSGKTLGLIGAGRIGERVAYRLTHGFDMKVVYHDIVRNEKLEKEDGSIYLPAIEDVLKESDFVSLHTPLLPTTRHLINKERLALMKPTAFLVNTSRGAVIDEHALVEALTSGVIAGAGLDVFEFEPNPLPDLLKLDNVVLTPHIASARETARNEMARIAAENVIDYLEGKTPRNLVNK